MRDIAIATLSGNLTPWDWTALPNHLIVRRSAASWQLCEPQTGHPPQGSVEAVRTKPVAPISP
jgi:hypothetical protein